MEIRYQREIRHNYLIIKIEREEDDYESRMAEENSVNGFLPLSVKEQGRERELYYEITSRQPLSRMVERKAMRGEELRHLILGIAGAVEEMGKYLLGEEHILLEPDFIYIEPQNYTISLCFVPGYRGSFPDALGKLTEYLLGKVSHDDREGVVLAYELFQATKQENYGIRDLLRILYQPPDGGKDLSGMEALLWEEENGEASPEERMGSARPERERRSFLDRFRKKRREKEERDWQMTFPEDANERVAEPYSPYEAGSGDTGDWEAAPPRSGADTAVLRGRQSGKGERRLVSLDGNETIEIRYFPFLIGKQEGLVDYALGKDTVSRLHARIDRENDGYTITDLNSTNGTRVDGRLLQTNETASLPVGSEIYLADAGFLFV